MKEIGLEHWNPLNEGATNTSGFSGLPGGFRVDDGSFNLESAIGSWWTSTSSGHDSAWLIYLIDSSISVGIGETDPKILGISVRCVKN